MDDLYVTSAAAETPELAEKYPHPGRLFVVKGLGHRGKERRRFKGTFGQVDRHRS
jgi:sugar lactone lactonase YvrE